MKTEDGKYQYSMFSMEDLRAYKDILEELPYDAELEAFFIRQGALSRKQKQQDKRHIASISFELLDNSVSDHSAEDEFFVQRRNRVIHDSMEQLTPKQLARVYKSFFAGKSLLQIAEEESRTEGAIRHCVDNALIKLRKYYQED